MVDDPRIRPIAEKLRADYDSEHDASHLTWPDFAGQARELFAVFDTVDLLRALLADEGRAVDLIARSIAGPAWDRSTGTSQNLIRKNGAARVLAALREVAGL